LNFKRLQRICEDSPDDQPREKVHLDALDTQPGVVDTSRVPAFDELTFHLEGKTTARNDKVEGYVRHKIFKNKHFWAYSLLFEHFFIQPIRQFKTVAFGDLKVFTHTSDVMVGPYTEESLKIVQNDMWKWVGAISKIVQPNGSLQVDDLKLLYFNTK